MTEQKQTSIPQTEAKSTARKSAYVSFINKYPLYSTLLVLEDYKNMEIYEECAIIRDALKEYQKEHKEKIPSTLDFPMTLTQYESDKHQNMLSNHNIVVSRDAAKEKAKLIKLKLPINNGLSNYKK